MSEPSGKRAFQEGYAIVIPPGQIAESESIYDAIQAGKIKLPEYKLNERAESLLRKCKFQRDMLAFLEKSVTAGDVIQAATVVKTIVETAGDIAYEAGRYNEALISASDKK